MTPPTPYSQTDQMQAVSYALGKCSELIPFSRCPSRILQRSLQSSHSSRSLNRA